MTPRIYVACLASYNNGILHGAWIDAAQDADLIRDDIGDILGNSPISDAEEWAVHDTDGLPDLGEWPDLDQLSQIAQGIEEYGEAFLAYLECFDADTTSVEDSKSAILASIGTGRTSRQTGSTRPADLPTCLSTYSTTSTSTRTGVTWSSAGRWWNTKGIGSTTTDALTTKTTDDLETRPRGGLFMPRRSAGADLLPRGHL